jgi:predicted alpha-1,2-mannosidase
MDGKVHRARGFTKYADYSGWDVYRSQVPLMALLAPDRASDLVSSLLADASESGWLPKWPFANQQTDVMTGDPADPTIASAYALGARRFDKAAALRAMVKGATVAYVGNGYVERPGLTEYQNLGYVPAEEEHHLGGIGSVASKQLVWGPSATTLEYASADFAIGAFGRNSCQKDTGSEELLSRSGSWRNVVNPTSGYAEPRSLTGQFSPTYDPTSGDGFVEGDGAQYTWHVLHDPSALIATLGGKAKAAKRLDTFFAQLNGGPTSPHAFLGNEPTLHTPYLYDWVGQPWKGQRVVRRAMLTLFGPGPGGMPGNDDLGTMSAWWVLSALGFYPVMPATGVLALGSPLFPHVVLDLPRGRVTLDAPGADRDPYIASLTVDGKAHPQPWLDVSALRDGAHLRFAMSPQPVTTWGTSAPPSGASALPSCRNR